MDQDLEHLRLLSIFHYVYAGLTALGSLCGLVYVGIGLTAFAAAPSGTGKNAGPPPEFGMFFAGIGIVIVVISLGIAGCLIAAGRFLAQKRNWTFCLVIACIICLNVPLGTVLGVFTIIVLSRPAVKEMFANLPPLNPRLLDQVPNPGETPGYSSGEPGDDFRFRSR